jgi:CMP-N-acetylneuraminic acid synthetase
MEQNYTAVIPVRAGSRRLKNKNISPFGGTNLLLYKIEQLKKVPLINNIVVSSDSDLMLNMAADSGVQIHKRNIEYCDEKTKTFGEVVKHIAENVDGDNIIWATCTSPLVTPELYQNAIIEYSKFVIEEKKYDSLVSFESIKRYLWDETGPINYKLGLAHVPSQQLPNLYIVTDGIIIAPRLKMIEWYYFHGTNPYKFYISKKAAVDIDDELDLLKARAWIDYDDSAKTIADIIQH